MKAHKELETSSDTRTILLGRDCNASASSRPSTVNAAMMSGLFKELSEKGQCNPSTVGLSCECEASSMDAGGDYAWDDVSNSPLDPDMVKAARKEELE